MKRRRTIVRGLSAMLTVILAVTCFAACFESSDPVILPITLTFDSAGGTEVAPITKLPGSVVSAPSEPKREGYRFLGWFSGGATYQFVAMPQSDLVVIAKWEKILTYTITFDTGGAPGIEPITSEKGERVNKPVDPVLEKHKFLGWFLDGEEYFFTVMPEEDITITAGWAKSYTIMFITGNDDLVVAPMNALAGELISAPKEPAWDGYKFLGWLSLAGGVPFSFSTMPAEDVTLIANWKAGAQISFDTGTSDVKQSPIFEPIGAEIIEPVPKRSGYHFDGWYTAEGKRYVFTTMPAEDITLTARWVMASILPAVCITLQQDDGSLVKYGSVVRENYVKAIISVGITSDEDALKRGHAAQFKGRGNGSWRSGEEKKPFRIKFESKHSFFGWPKSKHYQLISSSHNSADSSMLIADSAFSLAREVLTGLEYSVRTRIVDLYVNGSYYGVFVLSEKIRVEAGKLDIVSNHNVLDTGYLLEHANDSHVNGQPSYARFNAGFSVGFAVHSPDADDVADNTMPEVTQAGYQAQTNYIAGKTQELTNVLKNGNFAQFSALADVASFVDGYIIQELYRNTDVGHGGYYLYKKAGGKFYAGPPWDFDMTLGGGNAPEGLDIARGEGQANGFCTYPTKMPEFQQLVKARWIQIAPDVKAFLTEKFNSRIDSAEYQYGIARNWTKWGGKSQANAERDWINNAKNKRDWLLRRADNLSVAWGKW